MTDVDLNFLAKQMDRMLTEIGSFRDDMNVMMAILQRLDHRIGAVEFSVQSIGTQLTDMHTYNRRVEARVAKLEEKA